MKIDDILENLPTRDDLAKLVGLRVENTHDGMLGMLGAFSSGMILGAGLALLFAPSTGHELRRAVADKLGHGEDSVDDSEETDTSAAATFGA